MPSHLFRQYIVLRVPYSLTVSILLKNCLMDYLAIVFNNCEKLFFFLLKKERHINCIPEQENFFMAWIMTHFIWRDQSVLSTMRNMSRRYILWNADALHAKIINDSIIFYQVQTKNECHRSFENAHKKINLKVLKFCFNP